MQTFAKPLVLLLAPLLSALTPVWGQQPSPQPPQGKGGSAASSSSAGQTSLNPVRFDKSGYPILSGGPANRPAFLTRDTPRDVAPPPAPMPAPAGETRASQTSSTGSAPSPALASGMEFGSPLLDVYQRVSAPGVFKALGGRTIWWRLTVYGAQGEVIGRREVTHVADCAFAERDRLEFEGGRVYGRSGRAVFAEKNGMPWLTLNETAEDELALFGLQLRAPWCFADSIAFAVVGRDNLMRGGEALSRMVVERRPPAELDIVGPELNPKPRDRFEILYDPTSGQPREFVHRFASSLQQRRVLLEDWREVEGVKMPFRRIYVDQDDRQTTMLEMLRVEPAKVTERTFRLH